MSLWDKIKKVGGGVVSAAVGATTAGIVDYNPNTGGVKINVDGTGNVDNMVNSMTGGKIVDSLGAPLPNMPKVEDPALQAKRAQAEAEAKLATQVGERGKGLSATVLGGSTGSDNSVLKKRKLLGE